MFDITVTERCQMILAEYISEGDTVIDCTAGNGYDTLFLARAVGPSGKVLAFDVQKQALDATENQLRDNGFSCKQISKHQILTFTDKEDSSVVYLINDSHENITDYTDTAPQAIIYNLGYLPGGDHSIVTTPASTITSVKASLKMLRQGGVISVVTYPGHEEGATEDRILSELFQSLEPSSYEVLFIAQHNRNNSPNMFLCFKK